MILVLGRDGQIGQALEWAIGPSPEHVFLSRKSLDYCGDITNTAGITDTLMTLKPEIIINAAAYTSVDLAEDEPEIAMATNASAVGVIAQIAAKLGALLVHYSTDYVFDGHGTDSWFETDSCAPLSVYGESKRLGEQAIRASGAKHFILRTSWVYCSSKRNFLTTILKLAEDHDNLRIVNDQYGAPTHASYLAETTVDLINLATPGYGSTHECAPEWGIYHCAPSGETTWFEYARLVINTAKSYRAATRCKGVLAVNSAEYPSKAKRPNNSRLNTNKLQSVLGKSPPVWQDHVIETVPHALRYLYGSTDHVHNA